MIKIRYGNTCAFFPVLIHSSLAGSALLRRYTIIYSDTYCVMRNSSTEFSYGCITQ